MAVREIPELKADILKAKEQTGSALLAHYYIDPDIQEVADFCGDTLDMLLAAQQRPEKRLVICGVQFIAETIALLCPDKEIVLAHSQSRCPVSGQIFPGRIRMFREDNPNVCVISGLSASSALKAECDVCVTPDNAADILRAMRPGKVLFAYDHSLGEYLAENLPEIEFTLWNCVCPMHASVGLQDVELARQKWPDAMLAVNSCCRREVRQAADMVGSTGDIMRYCEAVEWDVIIADNASVCQALRRKLPERSFHQLAPSKFICSNMQINNLETVENAILGQFGAHVRPDAVTARRAAESVRRMLDLCCTGQ